MTKITCSEPLYALEHSQWSEDHDLFPWHISDLNSSTERAMQDCRCNHRGQNKWQTVFVGSPEDCQTLMDKLIAEKELKYHAEKKKK